jgi:hypothetical protein
MIRPDKCDPMDRERFTEAFVAILEASERPLPPDIVEDPIYIDNEDGSMTTLHITDHPLGRIVIAAREYFASNDDDDQEHLNFLYRFGGLHALIGNGALSEWVPQSADGQAYEVHAAVIHAAAELPMTKKGRFPRQAFIRKVQQIMDQDWRLPEFSGPEKGAEGTS